MHVLIVGAGLGGLMLAALLERAGVPYVVLERSQEARPLGSAICVTPTVTAVFKQLGVYDELVKNSLPLHKTTNHTHPASKPRVDDLSFLKERYDDYIHIITRPKLYDILRKLVPEGKIHFGKRVVSIQQKREGAMIRTITNETYYGDAVIGADGAYSTVREVMHSELQERGLLPKEDSAPPLFSSHCLVGVTNVLPSGALNVTGDECRYDTLLCKNLPYITGCLTQPDGSVAWYALQHAGGSKAHEDESLRNVEWSAGSTSVMTDQIRHLPCPLGQTMGYLIDNTPKDRISKVIQIEKWYKTWTYGRIALLGDACHSFFPAAGQGAVNAMLDAVVLANVLHACPTSTVEDIEHCFEAYVEERFIPAKNGYTWSCKNGDLYKKVRL
ncbi:hypothetical protein BGW42_006342 [Actinomortierella wolfii]|nr:hypothetical protein BGW42_006342 [Actinomortierella wolfii]